MKNIHLILIIAILILIYLISMQWFGDKNTPTDKYDSMRPSTRNIQTPPVMPENSVLTDVNGQPIEPLTPPDAQLPPTPPVVVETPTVTPTPDVPISSGDTPAPIDMTQLIEYRNASFGYHFSMPKQVYYAGFGAKDGATHTVAIQSDALPETFEDSTTRVLYYGKKVLPELKGTTRYVDPNGKYILLLIDGQYSVRIESDNLKSATVQAIEATIGVN